MGIGGCTNTTVYNYAPKDDFVWSVSHDSRVATRASFETSVTTWLEFSNALGLAYIWRTLVMQVRHLRRQILGPPEVERKIDISPPMRVPGRLGENIPAKAGVQFWYRTGVGEIRDVGIHLFQQAHHAQNSISRGETVEVWCHQQNKSQ